MTRPVPACEPQPGAPDWRTAAACKSVDPAIFFDHHRTADCRTICAACPVAHRCLLEAIAHEDPTATYGFRAGMTAEARSRIHTNIRPVEPLPATEPIIPGAGGVCGCGRPARPRGRLCWRCTKRQAKQRQADQPDTRRSA